MSNIYNLDEIQHHIDHLNKSKSKKRKVSFFSKNLLQITLLPVVFFIILHYFIGISTVSGTSMMPNYLDGDLLLYNRLSNDYRIGDIVVIKDSYSNKLLLKRIIALENSSIEIVENNIIINNNILSQNWVTLGITQPNDMEGVVTTAENEYFVMGDNREVSLDSRSDMIGTISEDEIIGKVFYKFDLSR